MANSCIRSVKALLFPVAKSLSPAKVLKPFGSGAAGRVGLVVIEPGELKSSYSHSL
jgi:hypothetical protein